MRRVITGLLALALLISPSLVFAQANGPVTRTVLMQNAAAATGNGTILPTNQAKIAVLDVVISNTATVTFEGTVGGDHWSSIYCALLANTNPITGVTYVAAPTSTGIYRCNVAGLVGVRARVSAWTSGTVNVYGFSTSYGSGNAPGLQN